MLPRVLDIRQPAYTLASPGSVLVPQYGPGCLPVCRGCSVNASPKLTLTYPPENWSITDFQSSLSHLGVDIITDLPNSGGFICILIAVDRFSKACKLIPLRGLPTALETAETLFHHLFCIFGIPEDIVSDRGPQFISRVWKSFLSLSLGYHPLTIGHTER